MAVIDLTGERFGRLFVIERSGSTKQGKATWRCVCNCGKEVIVTGSNLRTGNTRSCGCYNLEMTSTANATHGMSRTRLFNIWNKMRSRCNRKDDTNYKHYGGRGIKVCQEWNDDFASFMQWALSNGYQNNLSIDRIDVNGNYEPSNCRWASAKQQSNNRRSNHIILYNGESHTVAEWSEIKGIPYSYITKRLRSGWSIEKIFKMKERGG